jgi:hypothetical protein
MFAYCANNPVMFIDPDGDSFTIVLLYVFVISLISFSTYACIPESRPFLDPIFNNISFSAQGGHGLEYEVGDTFGLGRTDGSEGVYCDITGCYETNYGHSESWIIYSETSYWMNGKHRQVHKWGIPFIGYEYSNGQGTVVISIGGSFTYQGITSSASLDIDIWQIIIDYKELIFGENYE